MLGNHPAEWWGQYQRAGRDPEKAGRDQQQHVYQRQRVGAPGHGFGGNGSAPPDSGPVPARQIPAGVRSAGRLQQHRRGTSVGSIFPSCSAAGRDSQWPRCDGGRFLYQPGARQVGPPVTFCTAPPTMLVLTVATGECLTLDPSLAMSSLTHPQIQIPADTTGICHQRPNSRFWEAPVKAMWDRAPGRRDRPARQGISTCAGLPAWCPAHRNPDARRVFMQNPRDTKDRHRADWVPAVR